MSDLDNENRHGAAAGVTSGSGLRGDPKVTGNPANPVMSKAGSSVMATNGQVSLRGLGWVAGVTSRDGLKSGVKGKWARYQTGFSTHHTSGSVGQRGNYSPEADKVTNIEQNSSFNDSKTNSSFHSTFNNSNASIIEVSPDLDLSSLNITGKPSDRTVIENEFDLNNFDIIKDNGKRGNLNASRQYNKRIRREEAIAVALHTEDQEHGKRIMTNSFYYGKMSYAECAKTAKMLEVRASDNTMLTQSDFDHIDNELVEIFTDDVDYDWEYDVLGGLSFGVCWFACANIETAEYFKEKCEGLTPAGERNFRYIVYEADEKPFRFVRGKIHHKFWRKSREHIQKMLLKSNKLLVGSYKNKDGKDQKYHFRVCTEMSTDKSQDCVNGFYWLTLEIDEHLFQPLASEYKGKLKLGATEIMLQGSGMVRAAKNVIRGEVDRFFLDNSQKTTAKENTAPSNE